MTAECHMRYGPCPHPDLCSLSRNGCVCNKAGKPAMFYAEPEIVAEAVRKTGLVWQDASYNGTSYITRIPDEFASIEAFRKDGKGHLLRSGGIRSSMPRDHDRQIRSLYRAAFEFFGYDMLKGAY